METYTALLNPIAGGGRAAETWRPIGDSLVESGHRVQVIETRGRDHAIEAAAAAAGHGDLVVAVGGDGMVRDAASGVVPEGGRLGIVPAGRGNDFARTLGLPGDAPALTRILREGATRSIDVLEVNGFMVPGNVYVGIDAAATAVINGNRWMPAALLYRLAPVRAILTWRAPTYELCVDGVARSVRAHTVVVGNSGAYGHGLCIVPSARLDDGAMHVLVVGDGPRTEIVKFMRDAKTGVHVDRPEVSIETATELTIGADRPLALCADGDQIGELPATVRIRQAALDVIALRAPLNRSGPVSPR